MFKGRNIPYAIPPYVSGSLFFQECAHFLQLATTSTSIVEQVAKLAGIWFDFWTSFLELGIAFEDQDLMLRPKLSS